MTRQPIPRSTAPSAPWLWALCLSLLAWTGCETAPLPRVARGPEFKPLNVFQQTPVLPPEVRRVAVLPLAGDEGQVESVAANQALAPVLRTELLKTGKCDWTWVAPETLRQWTGRKAWAADDALPTGFLAKLREETGCDGVLFSRVTRFHPYPPLVIALNVRLVAANGQTLWAVDETFDASEAAVSNGALRYEQQHPTGAPATDKPMILTSPRRFGQYAAAIVLATMPAR